MISYTLICSQDHSFDAWFRGGDDYAMQIDKGLVTCPVCGDSEISKALMAPNVSTGRSQEKAAREVTHAMAQAKAALEADKAGSPDGGPIEGEVLQSTADDTMTGPPGPVAAALSLKDAPAPVKAYVEAVRKLRSEVEANSEDVGKNFASEARKMHHGESEERAIRGEASLEEAAALDEEGIDVFMLPNLPEDGH
jgi:hypothetical protein